RLPRRLRITPRRRARLGARGEPIAAVGALAIGDALGARLATLVVSARIVMRALTTGMEIGAAGFALVAKADALAARERPLVTTRRAAHERTLRQRHDGVKRARGRGDSLRADAGSSRAPALRPRALRTLRVPDRRPVERARARPHARRGRLRTRVGA